VGESSSEKHRVPSPIRPGLKGSLKTGWVSVPTTEKKGLEDRKETTGCSFDFSRGRQKEKGEMALGGGAKMPYDKKEEFSNPRGSERTGRQRRETWVVKNVFGEIQRRASGSGSFEWSDHTQCRSGESRPVSANVDGRGRKDRS